MKKMLYLYVAVLCFLNLSQVALARPTGPLEDSTYPMTKMDAAIWGQLKTGDEEEWRRYGRGIVDFAVKMVEEGLADNPYDAILILFHPNLTPDERREALGKVKLVIENVANEDFENESLAPVKKQDDSVPKNGEAAEGDQYESDEQLRKALSQLKIDPVESLANAPDLSDQKFQPQPEGQKEMPIYLGTHEAPEGIWWRG